LLFNEDFRIVGRLCLDFHDHYKKVPGNLDSLFTDLVRSGKLPEAEAVLLDKKLRVISDQWSEDGGTFDVQHQFDRAVTYFRLRRMELRLPNLEKRGVNAGRRPGD
jgi:hypothetical protein